MAPATTATSHAPPARSVGARNRRAHEATRTTSHTPTITLGAYCGIVGGVDLALRLAGVLVLLIVGQDVFSTVLFPASGRGIVRKPLGRASSKVFHLVAKALSGRRRNALLGYLGPVQIVLSIAAWFLMLLVGWAMIYQPALGSGIRAISGPTDTGWANALYYSGFSLTTLGVGDLEPVSSPYRLLTVVQAAIGFAWFSMVITYFLSVYGSLISRNAFAQGLHQRTQRTGDAVELLVRSADGADFPELAGQLSSSAGFLRDIYQRHRFYPVLRYFHYREPHYSLPHVLTVTLDMATLLKTAFDPEYYARLIRSTHLDEVLDSALTLLDELITQPESDEPDPDDVAEWRHRFADARKRFTDAGLVVRDDVDDATDEYVAMRAEWAGRVEQLADRTFNQG